LAALHANHGIGLILADVPYSFCLLVIVTSPANTAEPVEMLFEMWTVVGPINHVLDGGDAGPHLIDGLLGNICLQQLIIFKIL